jgi:hypothetical protein
MDENTNVDVFEEIKENYPRSSEYAKAQVMCWMKYQSPIHIKGIESWIKQDT